MGRPGLVAHRALPGVANPSAGAIAVRGATEVVGGALRSVWENVMKSQKFGSRSASLLLATMAVSSIAMVEETKAAIIIDIQQVGADVVATFSGSWNDSRVNMTLSSSTPSRLFAPGVGGLSTIWAGPGSATFEDNPTYFLSGGPVGSWGTAVSDTVFVPDIDTFSGAINFNMTSFGDGGGYFFVDPDYVLGSLFSGSWTFENTTMVALNLDNYGSYTYFSAAGAGQDSITVNLIGTPSAIPGAGLASVASLALAGLARRRRR